MRFIKNVVIGLAVLVVAAAVVGFLLPRVVTVERSTVIAAPPEKVFGYVNNLRKFNDWSPWFDLDPGMAQTFTGPEEGVGARMSWKSDQSNVGAGSMEIIESVVNERVRVSLDFGDKGNGTASHTLASEGDGTRVTWGFRTDLGPNPLMRYVGLMFDKWIGPDYAKGLAKLKAVAES